jgi:hypothetical protein
LGEGKRDPEPAERRAEQSEASERDEETDAGTVVLKLTSSASMTTRFESWSISRPGVTCRKIARIGRTRNASATAAARK